MSFEHQTQESGKFEFKYLPEPEQRRLLVRRTLELIHETDNDNVEGVLFLDKAARPLAAIYQEFWEKMHPDIPHPQINFMQVGSETRNKIDYSRLLHGIDLDMIGAPGDYWEHDRKKRELKTRLVRDAYGTEVERIRKEYSGFQDFELAYEKRSDAFLKKIGGIQFLNTPADRAEYRNLLHSDPKIMIVDDVSMDYETIMVAAEILKTAFPGLNDRQIKTFVFGDPHLRGDYDPRGLFESEDKSHVNAPWSGHHTGVWKGKDSVTGVVDNPDKLTAKSAHKAGFLPGPINELREEMHQIVAEHELDWQDIDREIKAEWPINNVSQNESEQEEA